VRDGTLCACIFDEVAFWRDHSTATPDTEAYTAVLPSLLSTNGTLVAISSAYRRVGVIYNKHRKYFGVDDADVLVVQGGTTVFHSGADDVAIAAMRAADPAAAPSEWDAAWRDDLASFLDEALIEAAVDRDRPLELPPRPHSYAYRCFVDASGGASNGDAYAFCIGHRHEGQYIIDVVRGRRGPFDPVELTKEYAALCREYELTSVTGDRYALEWVVNAWEREGLRFEHSEKVKSELYLETLPLFTREAVSLPDHPVLLRELRLLERSPTRLGRDQLMHPRGARDDYANVVCGLLHGLAAYFGYHPWRGWVDPDPVEAEEPVRPRIPKQYEKYAQPCRLIPADVAALYPETALLPPVTEAFTQLINEREKELVVQRLLEREVKREGLE
jgi:hypothetical protein